MFLSKKYLYLCVILYIFYVKSCVSEPVLPPMLVLYSPGELEYTDVLVHRVHDNLTLVCELRGDSGVSSYVWNYVGDNGTAGDRSYTTESISPSSSKLIKTDLQVSDSGRYLCSAPPFSVTKYIVVQTKGPLHCARSAFWCGTRCVLPSYVCDGRADCERGEDESSRMCGPLVCSHADKLNCSGGRCISSNACCRGSSPLCQQPACCLEHTRLSVIDGYVDPEYPPLYEDRRAPDDYGFIQSTIYTVTACALIFMIAVVLLVSAICKMQMKRAALRGYSHADRAAANHYSAHYHQAQRFPPCYEASRLLEERGVDSLTQADEPALPGECEEHLSTPSRLTRLSNIFSARYRQVPSQPAEVELHELPSPSYMSVAPAGAADGGALNCVQLLQARRDRLTLQVGRFQLTLPRLNRAMPRPATPTVAELDLAALDFVRVGANETYTLNGRTIRLLGAEFEHCPGTTRPPTYTEAVRYKLYGPPPEYLSREGLNRQSTDRVDEEAASNVEMPPCYDDLTQNNANNDTANGNSVTPTNNITVDENINNVEADTPRSENDSVNGNTNNVITHDNDNATVETLSSIIDNLPAIDSDINANDAIYRDVVNSVSNINNGNDVNNVICNE